MSAYMSTYKVSAFGKEKEKQSYPPYDSFRIYATLEELLPDMDGVHEIEYHITQEGLIINVTDISGEIIGTSSETHEELSARLAPHIFESEVNE
jgi:hypothetical protein